MRADLWRDESAEPEPDRCKDDRDEPAGRRRRAGQAGGEGGLREGGYRFMMVEFRMASLDTPIVEAYLLAVRLQAVAPPSPTEYYPVPPSILGNGPVPQGPAPTPSYAEYHRSGP